MAGLTCLSSPTTMIFLPSQASSSASGPDWLASSMMTTSKRPASSIGTVAVTWYSGMIQAGTAPWHSRRLSRACIR